MTNPENEPKKLPSQEIEHPIEPEAEEVLPNKEANFEDSATPNRKELEKRDQEIHNTYSAAIQESEKNGNQESVRALQEKMEEELLFVRNEYKKFNSFEFRNGEASIREYIEKNGLNEMVEEFHIEQMKDVCRLSLVIPSCQEGPDILHTLESIVKQKNGDGSAMDPEVFEEIIVVNQKESSSQEIKSSNQETLQAIDEFKKKNPTFNIHAIFKEFSDDKGGIGWARKLGSDLALARSFARQKAEAEKEPLYIAGSDADTIMDEGYVGELIDAANNYSDAAYGGGVDFDHDLEKVLGEEAAKKLRLEGMRELLLRAFDGGLQGANFAIREDIYARMGGSSIKKYGEDAENDQHLRALGKQPALLKSKHLTSSRRMIKDFEGYLASMRGDSSDYFQQRATEYSKVEGSGEQISFTPSELDEIIAYQKLNRADLIIRNLTPENFDNPAMIQFIGKENYDKLKNLTPEEFEAKVLSENFKKELRISLAYNMSKLFSTIIPYTEKDKVIIGIPKERS